MRPKGSGLGLSYIKRGNRHEHRCVAEEKLGRKLLPGEIVHHKDNNKRNNHPDNIEVLPSQAEHARLHFTGVKRPAPAHCKQGHALSGDNVYLTAKGHRQCIACRRVYDNEWKKEQRRARGLKPRGGTSTGAAKRSRNSNGQFTENSACA